MYKKVGISFIFILAIANFCPSQKIFKLNSTVENFAITKAINTKATAFSQLQKKLTIIDFFGTWCIPCVRALPHLTELKNKFKDSLSIVLISTEEKAVLEKFVAKQNVNFPIIVDETEKLTALFQPPSYPYTIVINELNKIAFIGNATAVTDSLLFNILQQTRKEIAASYNKNNPPMEAPQQETEQKPITPIKPKNINSSNAVVALSQQLLYNAKTNIGDDNFVQQLTNLPFEHLVESLKTDDDKKAFWINVYNAFTYIQLSKNADLYLNRNQFFKNKNINIAGNLFSLDLIEHGILRRSKIKWSLGYINKFFPSTLEKRLRVDKVDYRIHFALNCGAKSCPPIAFYNNINIDEQLNLATKNYLQGEVKFYEANNRVDVPILMSWFRGDFNNKQGVLAILKQHQLIPTDSKPKLKYIPYNWTLYLNNHKN